MAEPLVFVPGMMCDARVFLPQIIAFSATHPVQVAQTSDCSTIASAAMAVLDAAPARFAMLGLSMGGIIAMEVMRRAPERLTRVALMSTSAQAETPAQAAEREPQIVRAQAGKLNEAMAEALPQDCLAAGPRRGEVMELMQQMAADLGPLVFAAQSRALQRRPDQQKTLRLTRVPAYVICGRHDTLTPIKRHEFMAELIPHATLRIIEEAGHLPTVEAPDATNAALRDWLSAPFVLR